MDQMQRQVLDVGQVPILKVQFLGPLALDEQSRSGPQRFPKAPNAIIRVGQQKSVHRVQQIGLEVVEYFLKVHAQIIVFAGIVGFPQEKILEKEKREQDESVSITVSETESATQQNKQGDGASRNALGTYLAIPRLRQTVVLGIEFTQVGAVAYGLAHHQRVPFQINAVQFGQLGQGEISTLLVLGLGFVVGMDRYDGLGRVGAPDKALHGRPGLDPHLARYLLGYVRIVLDGKLELCIRIGSSTTGEQDRFRIVPVW
jgi:hypothetical protein